MASTRQLVALMQEAVGMALTATDVENVFKLTEPLTPSKFGRADAAREALVRGLCAVLPHGALWLDEHDGDVLDDLGEGHTHESPASGPIWAFVRLPELERLMPSLNRGAWALFLAESDTLSETGPRHLTFEPQDFLALTERLGAQVGIVSWYDDVEWLIALAAANSHVDPNASA